MGLKFDRISDIVAGTVGIRLKARVARLWSVPSINDPDQTESLEMVLIDEDGAKIQASVENSLLYKFSCLLKEGFIYNLVDFTVVGNIGHYKATFHDFKLIFIFQTAVMRDKADGIPMFGLTCVPFFDLIRLDDDYDHLIDVIGLLLTVTTERRPERDGRLATIVVMELADHNGTIGCALSGEYVDQVSNFLNGGDKVQVVVVVQFAMFKRYGGMPMIQNIGCATRLLFNPYIEEVAIFRNRIYEAPPLDVDPFHVVVDNTREGLEMEFIRMHPRKLISELHGLTDDGLFLVLASIIHIDAKGSWFDVVCKCNRLAQLHSNVYFCYSCMAPVLHVYTRYKLKVVVADDSGSAIFLLDDRDVTLLLNKTCDDLVFQPRMSIGENGYPILFDSLIGKRMIFKLQNNDDKWRQSGLIYDVKKVCTDDDTIAMFHWQIEELTPKRAIFVPPFPTLGGDVDMLDECFSDVETRLIMKPASFVSDDVKFTPLKRKLDDAFLATQHAPCFDGSKSFVEDDDANEASE